MASSPEVRWSAIERLTSAAARGRALEELTTGLFREQHFHVDVEPAAARSRQADVLAVRGTEQYLIECRWRADRATTDDVDALRARLARNSRDLVGVLVGVAGFTGSVLRDVGLHREQPVLLFSKDELRRIAAKQESLPALLWRKRDALLTSGTVLLDEPVRRRARRPALPGTTVRFVPAEEPDVPVISFGGDVSPFVFAPELPDLDGAGGAGPGVTLDVDPGVLDERGLDDLLDRLAGLGWVTPGGSWTIQQSTTAWHGLGPAAFRAGLGRWRERAASVGAHPSEEIHYVDRCDGGFYTLRVTLSADRARRSAGSALSFQLLGVPLDPSALLRLCQGFGVHRSAWFRPRSGPAVLRTGLGGPDGGELKPLGLLVRDDARPEAAHTAWVTGVVAANPFRDGRPLPPALDDVVRVLSGAEYCICALREHHPFDGRPRRYDLTAVEHAWSTDLLVCRPVATWTNPSPVQPRTARASASTAADVLRVRTWRSASR